uniref:Uncharacterized protein n=1 Tax=Siphoviridae sp. ctnPP24 TaxID=2825662 RepID=A0A8S5TYX8_9CAUD|nr:MAG TPA: hypothetical protein [Siphoviridae sp. ctnPP24]
MKTTKIYQIPLPLGASFQVCAGPHCLRLQRRHI